MHQKGDFVLPDIDELVVVLEKIAKHFGCNPMDDSQSSDFIQHVLYGLDWWGTSAKNRWDHFEHGLITERELCRFFLEHSRTKIAYFNGIKEHKLPGIFHREIFEAVELVMFGRLAKLTNADIKFEWDI